MNTIAEKGTIELYNANAPRADPKKNNKLSSVQFGTVLPKAASVKDLTLTHQTDLATLDIHKLGRPIILSRAPGLKVQVSPEDQHYLTWLPTN